MPPARPTTPGTLSSSSRPTTPGSQNPFDAIQKPNSLAMERIKHQTSATLDRMSILQQRYRQHQEIMKASGDPNNRRISSSSQADDFAVCIIFFVYNYYYVDLML